MGKKLERRAIGVLVSDDQNHMLSKQALIRDYAIQHDLKLAAFLAIATEQRKAGLTQAIELAVREGAFCLVLDQSQSLMLIEEELINVIDSLLFHELGLVFADTGVSFDQKALSVLKNLFCQSRLAYKHNLSVKIRSGLRARKKRGKKLGAKSFGLEAHEKLIIEQILKLHKEGKSLQKICDVLIHNDVGSVRQKKWHPTTVKRIIDRAKNSL